MATRNRTKDFVALREQLTSSQSSPRQPRNGGGRDTLLDDDIRINFGQSLPPEWVDVVENIQKDLGSIRDNIDKLKTLQASVKITFDDDVELEQQQEIDIITRETTHLLRKSEQGLKRIATIGNDRGVSLPAEERSVRLNVMRHLGFQLQGFSKEFRKTQKDFIQKLQRHENGANEFFVDEGGDGDEDAGVGMSASEVAQLEEFKQSAEERHQEIVKIATSINDLATLFRELSVLVIEQGTILDRIDYNIEQTLVKVQKGTSELVQADK
jgi:syntaxin 16